MGFALNFPGLESTIITCRLNSDIIARACTTLLLGERGVRISEKSLLGGIKKNLFFRWGYIVVCVGEGGGLREGGKGLSKFEVNLKLLNTSIKSIFGITYSI